jgi:hypothetical protein
VVESLDIKSISHSIHAKAARGVQPYYQRMMLALPLYSFMNGICSSRQIAAATYERTDFRVLSGNQHPFHTEETGKAGDGARQEAVLPPQGDCRAGLRPHQGTSRLQTVFAARRMRVRAEWTLVCLCHNPIKLLAAQPELAEA